MTAAAVPVVDVRRRRPRLDVPSRDRDPHGLPGPQPQPQPRAELACQSARSTFAAAERAVERCTALGVSPPINGPIGVVLAGCADCPFRIGCYQTMTAGTYRYTGIAGGVILHQGEPYVPRSEAKRTTSSGVSSF